MTILDPDVDAHSAPENPPFAPAKRPSSRARIGLVIPLQLFLGAGWLRAGVEKVIDPSWWSGGYLLNFLEEQRPHMLPWFTPFADGVLAPLAPVVAWGVLWMQIGIAACLFTNRRVQHALWVGITLNVLFTMAGAVNPSAFYLVMQIALLFALSHRVSEVVAVRRAVAFLIPASLLAPFARTIHPMAVIEDPALVLAFTCVIAAATTLAISIPMARVAELAEHSRVGRWAIGRYST